MGIFSEFVAFVSSVSVSYLSSFVWVMLNVEKEFVH